MSNRYHFAVYTAFRKSRVLFYERVVKKNKAQNVPRGDNYRYSRLFIYFFFVIAHPRKDSLKTLV